MNIAIFSPSQNPYSETFIQAHKNQLKGTVNYYYGKGEYIKLENMGLLTSRFKFWLLKFYAKLFSKSINFVRDYLIISSLKRHRTSAILVEYGTHAYNLLSALTASKIPFIVHFHGYDASVKSVIERCENFQTVFEKAAKVIAVSKAMYAQLISLGCPQDKLVYNVYGPHNNFLEIKPWFSKQQFIAVGRFTDKKAPYLTLLAFKQVLTVHPNAQLILAGDGVLLNTCKNLVKHYRMANAVTFVGVVSPEEFQGYLKESVAFVQHSVTAANGDMEGTPVAILEASAAGLPVVATKHAGIPDVIVDGETGLLCEEQDVETMAKHMIQLLNDIHLAKRMGAAGKLNIKNNFNMQRHIQALQDVLECISEK